MCAVLDVLKNCGTNAAALSMFFLSLLHSYLYTNINWNDVKIIWLNEMCSRFIVHDIFAWVFIENSSFCGSSHNNLVWSQHRFNIEQHVLFEYDYMLRQWCSVRVNKLCVFVCAFHAAFDSFRGIFIFHTHSCKKVIYPDVPLSTLNIINNIIYCWNRCHLAMSLGFSRKWISVRMNKQPHYSIYLEIYFSLSHLCAYALGSM